MQDETGQYWRELCERASTEQDPEKLLELLCEINLLSELERSLQNAESYPFAAALAGVPGTRVTPDEKKSST
jgi:hypothetical protein